MTKPEFFRAVAVLMAMVSCLFFIGTPAYAACTSPSAPDGAKEWFSADKTYKFCIGSTWEEVTEVGNLTSCSTNGDWEWDSGQGAFKQCRDGTWRKLGCSAGASACEQNGGIVSNGYCWVLSESDEDCDQACSGRGGCLLAGVSYAGASNANCQSVLNGMGFSASSIINSSGTLGCYVAEGGGFFRHTSTPTCAANAPLLPRACACNLSITGGSCGSVASGGSAGALDYSGGVMRFSNGSDWYDVTPPAGGGGSAADPDGPVWLSLKNISGSYFYGGAFNYSIYTWDATEPVTYSKVSGSSAVTVSSSGSLTGTTYSDVSVTVRATDSASPPNTSDRTFTITVQSPF